MENKEKIEINCVRSAIISGDKHYPFANSKMVDEEIHIVADRKPEVFIQVGDLMDMYNFSRFSKSVNFMTPADELRKAKADSAAFFKRVQKASPKTRCILLVGNHSTTRIMKNLLSKAPEYESIVGEAAEELLRFPGVETLASERSEVHTPDWIAIHGWSCRPMFHANYFNKSVFHGHTHVGGVVYRATAGGCIFECDAGHTVDTASLPLSYTMTVTNRWVAGVAEWDKYGPRFIPL